MELWGDTGYPNMWGGILSAQATGYHGRITNAELLRGQCLAILVQNASATRPAGAEAPATFLGQRPLEQRRKCPFTVHCPADLFPVEFLFLGFMRFTEALQSASSSLFRVTGVRKIKSFENHLLPSAYCK